MTKGKHTKNSQEGKRKDKEMIKVYNIHTLFIPAIWAEGLQVVLSAFQRLAVIIRNMNYIR